MVRRRWCPPALTGAAKGSHRLVPWMVRRGTPVISDLPLPIAILMRWAIQFLSIEFRLSDRTLSVALFRVEMGRPPEKETA